MIIKIDGKPFEFDEEDFDYGDIAAMDPEQGRELLFMAKDLFSRVGLPFYLAFGTLLGAVRDHGIIPGDEDLDVFVDDENKLRSSLQFFKDNGLSLIRFREGRVYSFRHAEGTFLDVYIRRPLKHSIWSLYCCHLDQYNTPKKYFKSYSPIQFLGGEFMCPSNPEDLLEFWYGKTWRIPVGGHEFKYEVASAYYWKKTVHAIKMFLLKITLWDKWKHFVKK